MNEGGGSAKIWGGLMLDVIVWTVPWDATFAESCISNFSGAGAKWH